MKKFRLFSSSNPKRTSMNWLTFILGLLNPSYPSKIFVFGLLKMNVFAVLIFGLIFSLELTNPLRAQNQIKGDITGNWGGFTYLTSSGGSSYIYTYASNGGNKYFRLGTDWSGQQRFHGVGSSDLQLNFFTEQTLNIAGSDYSNAYFIQTINSYNYIFKTPQGDGRSSAKLIIFEVQGAVRSVSSVTQLPLAANVYPGQAVSVTATLDGSLSIGQSVYLRYTNDNFATTTVVQMTGSGTSYSADIPASFNSPSSAIKYYTFTSAPSNVAADGSNAYFYTINLNNNGNANYAYTVQAGWTTTNDGDWNNPLTWSSTTAPSPSLNMGTVAINHNVTLNQNVYISSLTIASSKTLTFENSFTRVLSIVNNGTIINNGFFTANDGKVIFSGAGTATGTFAFNNVDIWGLVNFGNAATINGILTINTGGAVITNAVTYGFGSTLKYNTANLPYNRNLEWSSTSGAGYPYHVQISNNTAINLGNGGTGTARACAGNLTIDIGSGLYLDWGADDMTQALIVNGNFTLNGSFSLSNSAGGDLILNGNYINNGTFNHNNCKVTFTGSSPQSLGGSSGSTFYDLVVNNTNTLTVSTATSVSNSLTVKNSATLQTDAAMTMTTGIFSIENGGSYIHNNTSNPNSTIFNSVENFSATSNF